MTTSAISCASRSSALLCGDHGLLGQHVLLRLRRGQRAGLGGFLLGLVDLGLVLGPGDRRLPGVLGLVALALLLGLARGLVGVGLGDWASWLTPAWCGAASAAM